MPFTVLDYHRKALPKCQRHVPQHASFWLGATDLYSSNNETVAALGVLLQQHKDKTPHSSGYFSSLQTLLLNFTVLTLNLVLLWPGFKSTVSSVRTVKSQAFSCAALTIMSTIYWIYYPRPGLSSELQIHTYLGPFTPLQMPQGHLNSHIRK